MGASRTCIAILPLLLAWLCTSGVAAQTRVMPVGDSITQGGLGYASYRYRLWFDLIAAGYALDFVGQRDFIEGGGAPNPADYPLYSTSFDRDHEGYWGWRTDEVLSVIGAATTNAAPDIVLIQLGTNDVGQQGAAGVTNADANLRSIISTIRSVAPSVAVLLAEIPPLGPGSSYYANAAEVGPLNVAIAQIVADLDEAQSPIVLVDHHAGYDLLTMMQGDGIHPNTVGEAYLASRWQLELAPYLSIGNIPPTVTLTSPGSSETRFVGTSLLLSADASDVDGSVSEVRFMSGATLIGSDDTAPYEATWAALPLGTHSVTAVAEDDGGATTSSVSIVVTVLPWGSGLSIPIANPSFEEPALADGVVSGGPGNLGGWQFDATPNTYLGIFNPPDGSYATAGGNATPPGANGANVAYLFNDGGPSESVEATQLLADVLKSAGDYVLTVAIGRFNPSQPYATSTYGGYRIELLAGATVIASDEDTSVPPPETFVDAVATVAASTLPTALVGQPLSIRFTISTSEADRSTHFDDVRLVYTPPAVPALTPLGALGLFGALLASGLRLGARMPARRGLHGRIAESAS